MDSAATTPSDAEAAAASPNVPTPGLAATLTPFTGLAVQFNTDLEVVPASMGEKGTRLMLKAKKDRKPYLPGQPRVRLGEDGRRGDALLKYLDKSHSTKELDGLLPWMRYIFVQTPSYAHVMPLHHQKTHARDVKVTEHPGLHLVWHYEMIFVKPMPAYFYSQAFWDYLKNACEADLYKACLGFVRSYYMLIQYAIDYELACKMHLIPAKENGERPTYEEWCRFIEPFACVGDGHVNRRYHYGELRLTRINRAAFLFRGNLAYFHIYPQWGSFLEHTLAPIFTVFVICSVVLDSMQVSLAAIEVDNEVDRDALSGAWSKFLDVSLWFPVVVMAVIAAILAAAILGMVIMGFKDMFRGNRVRKRKRRGDPSAGTKSHGMVW